MIKELAKGTAIPLVLRVLHDGPQHGYGLLRAIRERSGSLLEFTEGTIYPLLHQLELDGLLSSRWDTLENGRRRKTYLITVEGVRRLEEARTEWDRFRSVMDLVLGRGEAGLVDG